MSAFTDLQLIHEKLLSQQTTKEFRNLQKEIVTNYNIHELKSLAFYLGIDHLDLPSRTKNDQVRELIQYTERYDITNELLDLLQAERPHMKWTTLENVNIDEAEAFIQQGRQQSRKISSLAEREQLQAYLIYWAQYIYEQRGIKPNNDLLPPQTSLHHVRMLVYKWSIPISLISILFFIFLFILQISGGGNKTVSRCPDPELGTTPLGLVFAFLPDSTELTLESRLIIDNYVVPKLSQSNTILCVHASSAWPASDPPWKEADILEVAEDRAQSVVDYLVSKDFDPARFIIIVTLPAEENRNTDDLNIQAQDRFVKLMLITTE